MGFDGCAAYESGVGGKMNSRLRLTSAKVGVGVEVEAELGNKFRAKILLGQKFKKNLNPNLFSG